MQIRTSTDFFCDDDEVAVLERAQRWLHVEYPEFTYEEMVNAPDTLKELAQESYEAHGIMKMFIHREQWVPGIVAPRLRSHLVRLYGRLYLESDANTWAEMGDSPTSRALIESVVPTRIPALQDVAEALDILNELCDNVNGGEEDAAD